MNKQRVVSSSSSAAQRKLKAQTIHSVYKTPFSNTKKMISERLFLSFSQRLRHSFNLFPLPSGATDSPQILRRTWGVRRSIFRGVGVHVDILFQIRQRMVHFPMLRLVCTNNLKYIKHFRIWLQFEILDGNIWCCEVLPLREFAGLEIGNNAGVGDYCFLFEITDEAMTRAWRDKIATVRIVSSVTPVSDREHEVLTQRIC